ncbi:hypothetical protein MRX96_024043 [Rhipicephalus microplus]
MSRVPRCVFWSFDDEEWLTEGCWLKETNETHSVCACNHLTNFALAMDRRPPEPTSTEQKLQLFVYASFATCMVPAYCRWLHTASFQRCWRAVWAATRSGWCAGLLAGFLHYFWLAAYFWALLEGFQLYTVLLDVLGTDPPSSRLRWYYLLAYGAPAVIVCVSAGISPSSYGALGTSLRKACWIDMEGHQLWSFVGPAAFSALLCLIFLVMVFYKARRHVDLHATLKSKEQERIANTRSLGVHTLLVLVCLCLASSFAQLHVSRGSLVHTSLFSVLNILLGLAVLAFHCLSNEKVKRAVCRPWCRLPGSRLGGASPGGAAASGDAVGPHPGLFMHANGMLVPYSVRNPTPTSLSPVYPAIMELSEGARVIRGHTRHKEPCHTRSPIYSHGDEQLPV